MKPRRAIYSPLWQADGNRIRRVAPVDFIGRYMSNWFDYAICDEAHQLANDTAQGNGLGTLSACADRTVILTGTLLGGYASDVYNLLYRSILARWSPTGMSGANPGCDPLPRPTACWKESLLLSPQTIVARKRVSLSKSNDGREHRHRYSANFS